MKDPRIFPRMRINGKAFTKEHNYNIATSLGTQEQRALAENCSVRQVGRIDKRVRETGNENTQNKVSIKPKLMSESGASFIYWLKLHKPTIYLHEIMNLYNLAFPNEPVSIPTLSNELERLGMSRKRTHYFSKNRDENDRVAYWCNPPDNPTRPGIYGVVPDSIVDIDESGRYSSCSERLYGHSIMGLPIRLAGESHRSDLRLNFVIAADSRVGIIKHLFYKTGTTIDIFLFFMKYILLPAIHGTGKRIITMDNLNSHLTEEIKQLIRDEGHILILRPIHSPDFAFIEDCFHYLSIFMLAHNLNVIKNNFKEGIKAAFNCITPEHIRSWQAKCHFYVQGFEYKPYMGEQ